MCEQTSVHSVQPTQKTLLVADCHVCGSLQQQFHPWVKPMKKTANKSQQKLMDIFPNMKEDDVETLDKVITDGELEELLEAHGIQS